MMTKMFLQANKVNPWEDGYDADYPYRIELSTHNMNGSYYWTVGECEIDVPEVPLSRITAVHVMGLEAAIARELERSNETIAELRKELSELLCLTHTPELVE